MQIHLQQSAWAKNTLTYLIEKFTDISNRLVLKKPTVLFLSTREVRL